MASFANHQSPSNTRPRPRQRHRHRPPRRRDCSPPPPSTTTTTTGNIGHAVGRDLRGATLSSPPTPTPTSPTPIAFDRFQSITETLHPVGQGPRINAAVGKQYGPPQPAILWRGGDRLSAGRCRDVEGQQRHRVRVPDGPLPMSSGPTSWP